MTNQHWVVIDDINNAKNVYIFRANNELLISQNGKVEKAKWEYLGNNSLLIDRKDESFLFKHGFFDENILALKIDSKEEYAFLVNETRFEKELNSLEAVAEFLNRTYLEPQIIKGINATSGLELENRQSKTIPLDYVAPKYKITNKYEEGSIEGTREIFTIIFDDGEIGEIHLKKKSKHALFRGKPEGYWVSLTFLYENWESCVNAFHYFRKTKKTLQTGLINKY